MLDNIQKQQISKLEYLTDDEPRKSFNAKLCHNTGISYLSALGLGGVWGITEGLLHKESKTFKLRLNMILNSATKRGPFLGNNVGIIAMLFNIVDGSIVKYTDNDDYRNKIASSFLTGALFKSTKGPKQAVLASVIGGSLMSGYHSVLYLYNQQYQSTFLNKSYNEQ